MAQGGRIDGFAPLGLSPYAPDRLNTLRDTMRMTGLGDDIVPCGDLNSMFWQVGNMVPIPTGRAAARSIANAAATSSLWSHS